MNDLLERLKAKYPNHGFAQDPTDGRIGFVQDDMWLTNPFLSCCGRFIEVPMTYRLATKDALDLWAHNQPIETAIEEAENAKHH